MRHPILRFRQPALLVAIVLVYGTLGYTLIERWSVGDAFFMTLITISTVGYELVHPLSTAGKLFTATLIVGGVGTMLYAFGIFTQMLSDGQLGEYRRQRVLEGRVRALRDHFIICGYGRIGTQVAHELERSGAPFIVVDNNPEAVGRLRREDRLHLEGDAASEAVLKEAGIERARGLISAVDADGRAVYITLAARALNSGLYILSRAGRPESIRRLELAGANRVISPYRIAGHQLSELALRPALVDVMGDEEIGVEEVRIRPGSAQVGRSLDAAGLFDGSGAQLLALRRKDGSLHVDPARDLVLAEGDLVVALGSTSQLETTAARLQ